MKKKIFAIATLVLVLVLALSIMVACSDKGEGNQTGAQTGGSQEGGGEQGGSQEGGGQQETPITSEVGLEYAHTKTTITYASDEAKAEMLEEMEMTEDAFFNIYDQSVLDVKFLAENKATVIYNMGGRGEVLNLYYKVESGIVSFYSTEEDMQNGNVKTDRGIFSAQFKLSEDYKTLQWIADMTDKCNVALDCTIAK